MREKARKSRHAVRGRVDVEGVPSPRDGICPKKLDVSPALKRLRERNMTSDGR
jgi:hypothetical protein